MAAQNVYLFVFNTLADWEPGFAIAGMNNPAYQVQPGRFQVRTVGVSREPVTTVGGVTILPDFTLDEIEPTGSALLILPGGSGWEKGEQSEAIEKARQFLAAGVPVAAICGATAGLALGGLLDTRQHTSNLPVFLESTGYRGAHLYQNSPAVTDQNVITAGAVAPVDFAYQIFKLLGVYSPATLEAWYGLYKTGDPTYFFKMAQ
jgi:putative intracellular protease/amidase